MIIYPTIELLEGRCVSLKRGRLDEPQIWHVDPVDKARSFVQAGASWMHVTDFDAVQGSDRNADLIQEIIRVAGIPVQLGGGIRTAEQASRWIEAGAGRIVIGTLAMQDPALVKRLARLHPDQIVLALDVWQGQIMVEGWKQTGALTPEADLQEFGEDPLAGVIVTDIDSDIDEPDASLSLIASLAQLSRAPVVASGTVRTLDDVSRLAHVPGVSGAVIGRALFNRTVDLEEAVAVASVHQSRIADFQ